jgi:hypothetical protein
MPTPLKTLVICPTCAKQGRRRVLGKYTEQGLIIEKLAPHYSVIVVASSMHLICGTCGDTVFIKHDTVSEAMTVWQ